MILSFTKTVALNGPMPLVRDLAFHLWGKNCIFDADGDADGPEDLNWRQLYLCQRVKDETSGYYISDQTQRLEITPSDGNPDIVTVAATDQCILNEVLDFIDCK